MTRRKYNVWRCVGKHCVTGVEKVILIPMEDIPFQEREALRVAERRYPNYRWSTVEMTNPLGQAIGEMLPRRRQFWY